LATLLLFATSPTFATHLAQIEKDIQAWVDLFGENAVVEFPYASALSPPE
jgi:hypothetical protein